MKKVLVIGSGGAGKSTFSRRLHEITGLKLFHLDKLHWQAGWIETPKNEWLKIVENAIKEDEWIIDGNFGGTMELRLKACDTVVFLDFPRAVCLYRVFKRWLAYRNTNRPDMTEGCNEKIDLEFFGWIWSFQKTTKPKIEERLKSFRRGKNIIRLRSKKEVEGFLINLEKIE